MHDGSKFRMLLSCIMDDERRLAAKFSLLRKHPFFKNPCCRRKMCFTCKIMSHHAGVTCENRLRQERAIGVRKSLGYLLIKT